MMLETERDVKDMMIHRKDDHQNTSLQGGSSQSNQATLAVSSDHVMDNRVKGHLCPRHGKRIKTREKIEKLVSEGTKNYPAYLKLIYTGESDFSSDDEGVHYERRRDDDTVLTSTETGTKEEKQQQNVCKSDRNSCSEQDTQKKARTPEEKSALEEAIPERMNKSDSWDRFSLVKACVTLPKGRVFWGYFKYFCSCDELLFQFDR